MNESTQSALRVLIRDLLNMPLGSVRPADKCQPVEGETLASVKVSEVEVIGWAGVSQDDEAQTRQQTVNVTLTIEFLGDEASSLVSLLPVVLQQPDAQARLTALNIGYLGAEPARDLSALELDRWSRYQINVQLSTLVSSTINVIPLENINIAITADTI